MSDTSSLALANEVTLGPLTTTNRIVMPPLVVWLADESGTVTDEHIAHYRRSAGPGLRIVEATTVAPEGRLHGRQIGAWSDDQIPGLTRLAGAIHETGGLAGIQIHHAGGNTSLKHTYGASPLVPSLNAEAAPEGATEFTDDQIHTTLGEFESGVKRALEAGFDVIELHGAHGYLISQFLSPATNRRTDSWGGSPEARRRFLVEAITRARAAITDGSYAERVALTIRLGIAAAGKRELPMNEGLAAAKAAVEAGVDFLDISNAGGLDEELAEEIRERAEEFRNAALERGFDPSPTLLLAALARKETGVPTIGVNGIRAGNDAEAAVRAGICDLVAVGQGILADPGWARKVLGEEDAPLEPCQECRPRCFWFGAPLKCPARKKLAARGEQQPLSEIYATT